jgi:hypothetical protein
MIPKPVKLPMPFQLTLDQRIDQTIKILKAKRNKPITQTVKLKELNLWNIK